MNAPSGERFPGVSALWATFSTTMKSCFNISSMIFAVLSVFFWTILNPLLPATSCTLNRCTPSSRTRAPLPEGRVAAVAITASPLRSCQLTLSPSSSMIARSDVILLPLHALHLAGEASVPQFGEELHVSQIRRWPRLYDGLATLYGSLCPQYGAHSRGKLLR